MCNERIIWLIFCITYIIVNHFELQIRHKCLFSHKDKIIKALNKLCKSLLCMKKGVNMFRNTKYSSFRGNDTKIIKLCNCSGIDIP